MHHSAGTIIIEVHKLLSRFLLYFVFLRPVAFPYVAIEEAIYVIQDYWDNLCIGNVLV